ncbi:MmgE/PrpD family protein [Roseomonas sp. BN140053]|uniref:MmgE/PrpD family protein n=1 Tax=Roseomonas sp. BN140053 TaxID=3391898 RepID=UPI0039ECAB2F
MPPSLSQAIGTLVARTGPDAIPPAVLERARISLAHNLCVALAGRPREAVAHRLAKSSAALPAVATLLQDGTRVSAEGAALANAALMHARSQDDTHPASTSHPGSPVTAAALALAEVRGRTGAEFQAAIVLGYEAIGRIGRRCDQRVAARGFRAAGVFGVFGAAAAAARLLHLSDQQAAHALGLAAQMAGGLSQVWVEGSAEGPLQLGFAARNGVLAALAAEAGATAAAGALDGRNGFLRAYGDTAEAAAEPPGPPDTWQIAEATVKPHPVCAILQGPLELLATLPRGVDFAPDALAEVTLELSPFEAAFPGVNNPGPFGSPIATKLSAQFSLALALAEGRATLDGLGRLEDPAILALAERVRVVADPALEPRLSRLCLRRADGRALRAAVTAPVGRPDWAGIGAFAHALAPEMAMSAAAVDRLLDAVAGLPAAPDLSALVAALGGR